MEPLTHKLHINFDEGFGTLAPKRNPDLLCLAAFGVHWNISAFIELLADYYKSLYMELTKNIALAEAAGATPVASLSDAEREPMT